MSIMDRKNNMLTDISAELEQEFGRQGSVERDNAIAQAWEEYNARVLLDARKSAHLTQEEVGRRIG